MVNITQIDMTQYLNKTGPDCIIDGKGFLNEMYIYYNNMILFSAIWVLLTIIIYFGLELYKSIRISKARKGNEEDIISCMNHLVWIDLFQRLSILFLFIAGARMLQLSMWVMGG